MEQFGTLFDCWMVINYSVEHEKAKSPPGLGQFLLKPYLIGYLIQTHYKKSFLVRAECDVAFICRTYIKHGIDPANATRKGTL